jgi:antitoxin component YwqK of YwqJK toxin-antitoxin module
MLVLFGCGPKKVEIQYPNGKLKETYTVNKTGEKDGPYQLYSENGVLKEESTYKNGLFIGKRKLFYDDGTLEIEENYIDGGILEGPYKSYHTNGKLQAEKIYVNNILSGLIKVYYPNGQIKEEVTVSNNNENGPFTEYYQNGKVHWKGTYLNGDNEFGLLEEWDSLGAPIKRMKCDSLAICRTFWKPGMPAVNYDTLQYLPNLKF